MYVFADQIYFILCVFPQMFYSTILNFIGSVYVNEDILFGTITIKSACECMIVD